jgi:anti-anti-sigma factor
MTSPLDATVHPDGTGTRIVLSGRIDRDGDETMTRAWQEAREVGNGEVVLDFGATDYINSTGIALIVRLLAEARRVGRPVRASGLSEHYREIFRITRLSDFITLEDGGSAPAANAPGQPASEAAAQQVGGSR